MKSPTAKSHLSLFIAAVCLAPGLAAEADTISLNFVRGSSGATALDPAESAGVVASANWNNAPQANADSNTGFALMDDSGAATGATADWLSGAASWSVPLTGTGGASDIAMMTGYLDQSGNGSGQIHSVTVNNIPYAHYDVYLYHSSADGPNRTARYRANGTDLFTRNLAPANVFDGFQNAQYLMIADAANGATPAGNYVVWRGMSSSTLSIEAEAVPNSAGGNGGETARAPIAGIQIVEVTLPAGLPSVECLTATDIGINNATTNGELLDSGIAMETTTLTVYWGTSDGGSDALSWENSASAGTLADPGTFSAPLTGLSPVTLYYYRVYAENSAGGDWASGTTTFTTLPEPFDAIGLNFVRGSSGETPLDPGDYAGVNLTNNWNNSTTDAANSNTGFVLLNSSGIDSGATADWSSGGASWSVAVAGNGRAADMKLMTGYLDQSGDGNGQVHSITLNNIPYEYYDLYLYHSSSGGANRTARYTANGVDLFTRNLSPANTFNGFFPDQHDTLEDSNNSASGGNYVVWSGLSAATVNVSAEGIGEAEGGFPGSANTRRAPVQGIQIIKVEAPVSFRITAITYNQGSNVVTVTWESDEDASYEIDQSTEMTASGPGQWTLLDSVTGDAVSTSYMHTPAANTDVLFYRIRRL